MLSFLSDTSRAIHPSHFDTLTINICVDSNSAALIGFDRHETWHSPITNIKFCVDSDIKSRHTANEALKQAGLKKAF